jgi:phosphoribosylformylglycinamidine cyclo-ligase
MALSRIGLFQPEDWQRFEKPLWDHGGSGAGMSKQVSYASSGVDISRQDEALKRIKPHVKATRTPGVRSDIGLFGGLFDARFPEAHPILVSSMDGVGTKMKVARRAGIWDTVGQDLVNHCVNDILVQGARPLFFLDYIAAQRLTPEVIEQIVKGMATACTAAGCALIGGELAEMPGVYAEGEVDVAGTIVGVVDEADLLPRLDPMAVGDVLLGLPSSGLHTNGYSLARRVCFEIARLNVNDLLPGTDQTVASALLAIHRSYLVPVLPLVKAGKLVAMAHITGGGLTDNIPRVLPKTLDAEVDTSSWEVPALFRFLIEKGGLGIGDARQALNLGVGMVLVVKPDQVEKMLVDLHAAEEPAWVMGRLVRGSGVVKYK